MTNIKAVEDLIEGILESNVDSNGRIREMDFRNIAQQIARELFIQEVKEQGEYNTYLLSGGNLSYYQWYNQQKK
jgi:hypothetical protein